MPTDVVMPQMGESIAEGTIVRWIKKVGDTVERDEPLFEISTDKVDAEIPSPVAGVVTEIRAKEGETVPVNSVVAVIGPAGASGGEAGLGCRAHGRRLRAATCRQQGDGSSAPLSATPPAAQAPKAPAASAPSQPRPGRRGDRRAAVAGRGAPAALVAARAQDREGAQRRHLGRFTAPASPAA